LDDYLLTVMKRLFLSLMLFSSLLIQASIAQLYPTQYRVPVNWQEINTEHFRIIYPADHEYEARLSLSILEAEYNDIKELVGGSISRVPIIINPKNDRSNGFVSPLNFRSEIELSPGIGKNFNPQSGNWLEFVLPHELVHTMHFSENPPAFTRAIGLFSPDIRRSVHAAAPLGVFEGIAVQHESHNTIPNSGRGHHPYFRHQFSAMITSDNAWSMGQLLQTTDFTPPFDRHYIGGYEFTNWLLQKKGDEAVKDAIQFHYKYPFLGYGTALRHVTGSWPRELYRDFSADKKAAENMRIQGMGFRTDTSAKVLSIEGKCRRLNRPQWLDDETIIFYGRFCNRTSGFYSYNLADNKDALEFEVSLSPDFIYTFSDGKSHLYFSRYHTDLLYDNLFRGDVHTLSLDRYQSNRVTHKSRVFAPEPLPDGRFFALQTAADEMVLALFGPDGESIKQYRQPDHASAVQVALHPDNSGRAAVLGRMKSVQAIWLEENLAEAEEIMARMPDIVFENASVYDPSWHPNEEKFLFVSDRGGTMNVYEYHLETESVIQLTNSLHNAYEASYSPDGSQIAYITQIEDEQLIHVLDIESTLNRSVAVEKWTSSSTITEKINRPYLNRSNFSVNQEVESKAYRAGFGWLKPRLWIPEYDNEIGRDRYSLTFESTDVMSTQAYSAEFSYTADRPWYDITYTNSQFFPGFEIDAFSRPFFTSFGTETADGSEETVTFLQQSQGGSVKIPIPIRFRSNARFSSLLIEPQYFLTRQRFFSTVNTTDAVSEFGTRHTVGLRTVANIHVRQFIRDVQPNSGLVIYAEGRQGLNSDLIEIDAGENSITGNLTRRQGIRTGIITYLAPFSKWNQSLRLQTEVYSQTNVPVFNTNSRFSDLFFNRPFESARNIGFINSRYTIPIVYPDNGGLLLPGYLSNIYLVLFSQTAADLNSHNLRSGSRTVFGAGIRSRFRLSNLAFDFGISIGWEPTRNEITFFAGDF
jgi:hypothetical protein